MIAYLVGGAVRDQLLGLEPEERDWVVLGSTPEEMIAKGYRPVGKDFPVFIHPESGEEYALARTERKVARGYHGFEFHADPEVTIEEDLKRRDLTINAMAMDEAGELIDPFGGADDLEQGMLRHVSSAFREDPVRILRVARFAARFARWGFKVSHATNKLMRKMVADGEADALVPERVWKETERALGEQTPSRFFQVLAGCGALERLFPELAHLFGVPQPEYHHPEIDTGVHVLMVLDAAARLSTDTRVRFAALMHDVGKAETPRDQWPRHQGHEKRGPAIVESLCRRMKVPNGHCDLARLVARYHGQFRRIDGELNALDVVRTLEGTDAFRRPERFQQFLLACEADLRGRTGFSDGVYRQAELFKRALAAANDVDIKAIVSRGFKGDAIAKELKRERVRVVAEAMGLEQGVVDGC